MDAREDHLGAGRADVDADAGERHMVLDPDRIFLERAFVVGEIVVVIGKAVMGVREVDAIDVVGRAYGPCLWDRRQAASRSPAAAIGACLAWVMYLFIRHHTFCRTGDFDEPYRAAACRCLRSSWRRSASRPSPRPIPGTRRARLRPRPSRIRSAASTTSSPWWRSACSRRGSAAARCGWCRRASSSPWPLRASPAWPVWRFPMWRPASRFRCWCSAPPSPSRSPCRSPPPWASSPCSPCSTATPTAPKCRRRCRASPMAPASSPRPPRCMRWASASAS